MDKCIIVVGNLSDGFTFIGPFDCFDDADAYTRQQNWVWESWIATLETPEERQKDGDNKKP